MKEIVFSLASALVLAAYAVVVCWFGLYEMSWLTSLPAAETVVIVAVYTVAFFVGLMVLVWTLSGWATEHL